MSALDRARSKRLAGQRLLWLLRRAHERGLLRHPRTMSLSRLEDSRRPLLFSLLPRMLRADGTTPRSLQGVFRYIDPDRDRAAVVTVSTERWNRALATSRRLAERRAARERDP